MSAGGLSYSAITNYGRITLPSVEGGFGSMNILRDPPKSITTRRIDKVGQTSLITDMVDESHTRACENIRQFALGVNPFVSVSYSNEGNNGGQRPSGFSNINAGRQAYLPYTVMRDGAFRPPVMRQEQLMPLSRQPRIWTQAMTNPDFPDFSRRMHTCMENGREIRNDVLRVSARPTAVYTIEKPIEEPFEIKYVIQNPIHVSAESGVRTLDITEQKVQEPTKGVNDDRIYAFASTNKTNDKIYVNTNEFDPSRYIQDINNSCAFSNPSRDAQITSIDDIIDTTNIRTKDKPNVTYLTQLSGTDKHEYIHDDISLERNIPNHAAYTNTRSMRDGGESHVSRQYRLNEKINIGGMEGKAGVPSSERVSGVQNVETRQFNINKIATEMNAERYRR